MNKLTLAVLTFCLAAPVFGQSPTPISALVPRDYEAVRQYLTLSEAQIAQLKQVQEARQRADQAIYEQMHQRQVQLDQLLQQGSTDTANIGRLMVEINNLRRQLPTSGQPFRTQALAVLTEQQKQKLALLEEALRAQAPAGEAVALNLIDYPDRGPIRILPFPAVDASATLLSVR